MNIQRIVTVGTGAVGGSIGGLLAQSGLETLFLARGPHGQRLQAEGLDLRLPDTHVRVKAVTRSHPREVDWREGDVALLSTKLQDAQNALDDLLQAAGESLPIVCAVNGIHGERWAAERFATVLSMLVWLPATHLVPGEVRLHASGGRGVLDTGPHRGDEDLVLTQALCGELQRAGFDAVARRDIASWKRAKWITNVGGTAYALVDDDPGAVADAARAEAERVFDAAHLERVSTDTLLERVQAIGVADVDGKSRDGGSIWQSHAREQPMETPWIEGALVELGREHGVPTPINARLAEAAGSRRRLRAADLIAN